MDPIFEMKQQIYLMTCIKSNVAFQSFFPETDNILVLMNCWCFTVHQRLYICQYRQSLETREHKTNEYAWQAHPTSLFLLSAVKRRKLSWFGHICRYDTLPKIILYIQGTVDGDEDRINQGRTTSRNGQAIAAHRG